MPSGYEHRIGEWLQSKGCTLWGRSFDVVSNKDTASEWFAQQIVEWLSYEAVHQSRRRVDL